MITRLPSLEGRLIVKNAVCSNKVCVLIPFFCRASGSTQTARVDRHFYTDVPLHDKWKIASSSTLQSSQLHMFL